MRNADEVQADRYGRQIAELDYEIKKAQERLAYLRRTKGTATLEEAFLQFALDSTQGGL